MEKNRDLRVKIEDSLSKAKKAIYDLAGSVQFSTGHESLEHVVAALVKTILAPDRELNSSDTEDFRMVWCKNYTADETDKVVSCLPSSTVITVEEAAAFLNTLPADYKTGLLSNLAELIESGDSPGEAEKFMMELAAASDIPQEEFKQNLEIAKNKSAKRKKLLSSGAGILAALVILLIFILTATWLKSVIFGLGLAALMFPVEQYFERKLKRKKGLLYSFFNLCGRCESSIKSKLKSKKSKLRPTAAEIKKQANEQLIRNSVSMSCVVLAGIVIFVVGFFIFLSAGYLNSARTAVKKFLTPSTAAVQQMNESDRGKTGKLAENTVSTVTYKVQNFLEENRQRFESQPLIREFLNELEAALTHPDTKKQIVSAIVRKTGGIVNFTTGMIGALATFLLNVLLTIFFFLLFLTKLAQFAQVRRNRRQNYVVRALFSGNWLPRTSEENIEETERIIDEIGHKLKVWLRGYLSLMFIDFSVYSIVFYFLNVPYFLILGAIAGCGILLPFIGPILSAVITCLVTLSCGDATAMQIIGIIVIYLIHNGITEQFILYPTVIGESLGLTALETIIVVLLGGIFAGATGMILSIPAASVMKYLVPRIYHYLRAER